MAVASEHLRIEGVYEQKEPGLHMLRVKVPAGALSSEQAFKVCELSERFSGGTVHLTVRGSIELHAVRADDLAEAARGLAAVGLTSRGACGGAVRGIVCSAPSSEHYADAQVLARRLHQVFTGNPHFEALPRKFKIAVEPGYEGSRHLIQDLALVRAGTEEGRARYDVWAAGGLGREPLEAFLLEGGVSEDRVLPLVEATLRVHATRSPPGRRLKVLARDLGPDEFRRLVRENVPEPATLAVADGFPKNLTPAPAGRAPVRVEARPFAGQLGTASLRSLADLARRFAADYLVLTADQNVALLLADPADEAAALTGLAEAGFSGQTVEERVTFRICPGSHECRLGLCPTRDVANAILGALGPVGRSLSWAISGCPNSCSQPQLADAGIVTARTEKADYGTRRPLFDLYRREGPGFGRLAGQRLSLEELMDAAEAVG